MSCNTYRDKAIKACVAAAGGTPADVDALQAAYDGAPRPMGDQEREAMRRKAGALLGQFTARGYTPPEHLKPGEKGARSTHKWAALYDAMAARGLIDGGVVAEVAEGAPKGSRKQFDQVAYTRQLMQELRAEEQRKQAEQEARPTTPAMRAAMRAALDADPLLEDEYRDDTYLRSVPDVLARAAALAARLEALADELVPTRVRQALKERQELLDLGQRLRERDQEQDADEWPRRGAQKPLEAVCEETGPPPAGPAFPPGAWERIDSEVSERVPIPIGSVGRVTGWERGYAVVAFELPLTDKRGDPWLRDEDDPERRTIKFLYRPRNLTRLDTAAAFRRARTLKNVDDRALALTRLCNVPMEPAGRKAITAAALDACRQSDNEYNQASTLAGLLPHFQDDPASRRAAGELFVSRLPDIGDMSFGQVVHAAAYLDRNHQNLAVTVAQAMPDGD